MEWRKPFALVANKDDIPEGEQYKLHYSIGATLFTAPQSEADYVFKTSDTYLLIDIDEDNAPGVEYALARHKIDVNILYVIPDWEVPEAGKPMCETFLHRALCAKSSDVFKLLLEKGASPRIKGHCHKTVIENLFDGQVPERDIVRFGKMLIDAGVTGKEIKQASTDRKEYKTYAKKLIHYADSKKKKISFRKRLKRFAKDLVRTRD